MGIEEVLSTPHSPWQRAYVERTYPWRKTRRSHSRFNRPKSARSWHYPRSADLHHRYQREAARNNWYVLAVSGRPLCLHLSARSENLFTSGLLKPPTLTVLIEDQSVRHASFR